MTAIAKLGVRSISIVTVFTVGFFAYQAASRAWQISLFALAGFNTFAATSCDQLANAFFEKKFLETANPRNIGFCAAACAITLVTGVVRGGLVSGGSEVDALSLRTGFNPLYAPSTGCLDGRLGQQDCSSPAEVMDHYLTALTELGFDGIVNQNHLQGRASSDVILTPISVFNGSDDAGLKFSVLAKRVGLNDNTTSLTMFNANDYGAVKEAYGHPSLQDRNVDQWGDLNYVSFRVDWEDRNFMLSQDSLLPPNSDWPSENCMTLGDSRYTEEMDVTFSRSFDGLVNGKEQAMVAGRIGFQHEPGYIEWQDPETVVNSGYGDYGVVDYMGNGNCG